MIDEYKLVSRASCFLSPEPARRLDSYTTVLAGASDISATGLFLRPFKPTHNRSGSRPSAGHRRKLALINQT